jgi:hypothetical protein
MREASAGLRFENKARRESTLVNSASIELRSSDIPFGALDEPRRCTTILRALLRDEKRFIVLDGFSGLPIRAD